MAPLLPSLAAHARNLITSAHGLATRSSGSTAASQATSALSQLGPLAARSILLARDDAKSDDNTNSDGTPKVDPNKGVVHPQNINNTFVFVLFGLIGAAFVCTGIWFFFWAKNGGFHFRQNDWDDYKSTVLRRKGPNGTILSGATPTTQLGGGSVYKDVVDDGAPTEYTGGLTQISGDTGSTLTGITAGASDLSAREKRRQKRERKEREREKKKDRRNREKTSNSRRVGEDGVLVDEEAEAEAKDHLRAYRHEKAARVGGINKESEGSTWDGSTAPDNSTSAGSDLLSNRQSTPTNTPTKEKESRSRGGGIRKVYSTADRTADRENERLRAEARRLQREEKSRSGGSSGGDVRRNFSFQRAAASHSNHRRAAASEVSASVIEEETPNAVGEATNNGRYLPAPGGWAPSAVSGSEAPTESDTGTKSYHHVIPGISPSTVSGSGSGGTSTVASSDYAEEKRKKRGAGKYRRD
ncbi:uncharacterized protein F4822DRAFT_396406 [Hypoxylon trugodes]|uniref:uncharacterized protein n=1 Tax=Hypoxylon trugodes TaxID=326681 RepID=UPI0021A0C314|nr:uncharacterized protein F4822DRAFT_396406 [Hypoxylon trugodes]KAI1391328.1 hypothetical protein F4822DRAFT_396406 [Hypoxylon trugodes]